VPSARPEPVKSAQSAGLYAVTVRELRPETVAEPVLLARRAAVWWPATVLTLLRPTTPVTDAATSAGKEGADVLR
jgi:hypothetical protein